MGQFIDLTAPDGQKIPAYVAQPAGRPRGVAVRVFEQVLGRMYATAITVIVIALVVAVGTWLFRRFEVARRLRERFRPATSD